jgi:rubredoxin
VTTETIHCPTCGGKAIPIHYGEPFAVTREQARCGEVWLGGPLAGLDWANWHCTGCGYEFPYEESAVAGLPPPVEE